MASKYDHLTDTTGVSVTKPVFDGVFPATVLDYGWNEIEEGPVFNIKLQLDVATTDINAKDHPTGHIVERDIRFIPKGNWTEESAKQELRKFQLAVLQKPLSSSEALPACDDEGKETYIGQPVQLLLKPRPAKKPNEDGEIVIYQDCKFKAISQAS